MVLEKVGLNCGKEIMAWARNGKSLLATIPVKVTELRLVPKLECDVVHFAANDYLANIKKLALNEKDAKRLEDLLSYTELQESFNRVINRADIDLNQLKELFTGKEVLSGFVKKRLVYNNKALSSEEKLYTILERLETLQPKDLEIIKLCDYDALEVFFTKNDLGEHILPNKYVKNLSNMLVKDDISISHGYSPKLNGAAIECAGKNKTYFTFDPKNGVLEFIEENGTKQIKTVRNMNGNVTVSQINPNNERLNELVKERICLRDANGNPTELISYERSNIDGIFNVVKKDLKTGNETPLSKVVIDNTGKKTSIQNLVSPNGTRTQTLYEEMPDESTIYRYKITDKNNNKLLDNVYSKTVLNDSEFIHKINDKNYRVKFSGSDKIEILNIDTKHLEIVDLKTLLFNMPANETSEMVAMLKKVPANELLALNKYEITQLLMGNMEKSSTLFGSKSIASIPNEFTFLHELGHQKDMINKFSKKEKDAMNVLHKVYTNPMSGEELEKQHMQKMMNDPVYREKVESRGFEQLKLAAINCDVQVKTKISNNPELLEIYNRERTAFIEKFGSDDKRIDYFINTPGLAFGYQGEALAEINALLSTQKSEKLLGTRSYLLAENFPETIAFASKLL